MPNTEAPTTVDRSADLQAIFMESGLHQVLTLDWVEHKPKEGRTKLQFVLQGARRVRSLELVDGDGDAYPRVHFLKDVDQRIKDGLLQVPDVPVRNWGGKSTSTDHGISYEGGPRNALLVARHLRHLLSTLDERAQAPTASVPPVPLPRASTAKQLRTGGLPAPTAAAPRAAAEGAANEALRLLRCLDVEILKFASKPANRDALLRRTKSYSTPFRGTLFGEATQEAVAQELTRRPAGVLVLGANPNDSGENSPAQRLRHRTLEEQMHTGYFGESVWNEEGVPQPQWNASAKQRWSLVFTPLRIAGVAEEEVAFANFIPWGSSNLKELVDSLEPVLLSRVVELSEGLLTTIIQALRPRLMVVPESISNHLGTCSLARHRRECAKQSFRYPIAEDAVATFNYYAGRMGIGGHQVRVIHLRHPSSLHLTADGRHSVEASLGEIFAKLL